MAKRLPRKRSFKFGLPMFCGQSDVVSPRVTRSLSSSGRGSSSASSSSRQCELQRIFQHFDRDNDGKISGAELCAFFVSMGDDMPPSGGGDSYELDFAGFVALMEREGGQEEDLRRAFEVFNTVESAGRITARGLQRVLAQLGDQRPRLPRVQEDDELVEAGCSEVFSFSLSDPLRMQGLCTSLHPDETMQLLLA